ncbi:unnamed protein product, partial [Closterium sp. Yama58-4]
PVPSAFSLPPMAGGASTRARPRSFPRRGGWRHWRRGAFTSCLDQALCHPPSPFLPWQVALLPVRVPAPSPVAVGGGTGDAGHSPLALIRPCPVPSAFSLPPMAGGASTRARPRSFPRRGGWRHWRRGAFTSCLDQALCHPPSPFLPWQVALLPVRVPAPSPIAAGGGTGGAGHSPLALVSRQCLNRWRFYPCASPLPPPSLWVEALQARGIREINFVGDSHQRFLMLFINYLVMHDVDDALWKFHGDIVINIPPPKGRTDLKPLKMNFYWVDGMYHNDEYGCTRRGFWSHRNTTFPDLSLSADPYGDCGVLVPTNLLIEHMNGMIKTEIRRYGIGYLDGWPVEIPRYFDTCSVKDRHYTCHKGKEGTKNGMFYGDVGEAMVMHTMYNLLYKLW